MSPQKKMKKRKELNALIGLSDGGRKKSKSCGHRLLRTEPPESESGSSSEEPEFGGGAAGRGLCGKSPLQCCSLCFPLCVFVVLAACVMACAGLIWMQIALKEDLDAMKEKIHIMETSQKLSAHEILKLGEELKAQQGKLEELEGGERGLRANLSDVSLKLSALDSAVSHLKANIKSASDLLALPKTVADLQKSVASIGSTVTSVQHDVAMIQTEVEERRRGPDQLKDTVGLKDEGRAVNNSSCESLKQDVRLLQDGVSELNASLLLHQSWSSEQIQSVHFVLSNLSRWLTALERSGEDGPASPRRPRFLSHRRSRTGPTLQPERDVERLLWPPTREQMKISETADARAQTTFDPRTDAPLQEDTEHDSLSHIAETTH